MELFGRIDGRRGTGLHEGAAGHRGVRVRLMQSACTVEGVEVGRLASWRAKNRGAGGEGMTHRHTYLYFVQTPISVKGHVNKQQQKTKESNTKEKNTDYTK